jgi:hypothetical protein
MAELTTALKLLTAAGRLVSGGKQEFSAEDIAVKAHELFRDDFSLKGYPQFPDSNKVYTQLMGKGAPLFVRGWLEKVGTKTYRLTPKGAADLNQIDSDGAQERNVHTARRQDEEYGRILTSDVFDLFRAGQEESITFHQFCRFAGLSARDKWQKVASQLGQLDHYVKEIVSAGESGQGMKFHFRKRNYSYSPEELRTLGALLVFLKERFESEMDGWKKNALGQ